MHSLCRIECFKISFTCKNDPRPPYRLELLKSAKTLWNQYENLFDLIKEVSKTCRTCNRYQTAPSKPVVGLPMATKFQETVAMDLKVYDCKLILHLIDPVTSLSSA